MDAIRKQLADSMAAWEAQQEELRKLGSDFSEYLCTEYTEITNRVYYAFQDINQDGQQELLLGNADGEFFQALTIHEGTVEELYQCDSFRISEDGFIMVSSAFDFRLEYYFVQLNGYDPYGMNAVSEETVSYDRKENIWTYREDTAGAGDREVTETEARAVIDKYTSIHIPVYPIMEYPVDTAGTTLQEYIEANRIVLTDEERTELYRKYVKQDQESSYVPSTHYMLMDVNGDGLDELLLTYDESYIRNILTIKNGEISTLMFWTKLRPCENQVWDRFSEGTSGEGHYYFTLDLEGEHPLERIAYSADENSWARNSDGSVYLDETITKEQYESIVASHPPLSMNWKPVSEFPEN